MHFNKKISGLKKILGAGIKTWVELPPNAPFTGATDTDGSRFWLTCATKHALLWPTWLDRFAWQTWVANFHCMHDWRRFRK